MISAFPQKEGVSASEIATRNRKSLATFHRTLKSQCKVAEIAREFWGPRWASQSQKSLRFRCAKVDPPSDPFLSVLLQEKLHTRKHRDTRWETPVCPASDTRPVSQGFFLSLGWADSRRLCHEKASAESRGGIFPNEFRGEFCRGFFWLGCTPRGSCNNTLLRRGCFLEGFLEGACGGFQ